MEQRTLGHAPFTVSTVGLGCNNFGRKGTASESQEGTNAVMAAALDAGVTFFDNADLYGGEWGLSETLMGNAWNGRRDEAVLATKFGFTEVETPLDGKGPKGSREYLRAACEASLTRLQTDRIDLFQQHQPDPHTPIEDTLGARPPIQKVWSVPSPSARTPGSRGGGHRWQPSPRPGTTPPTRGRNHRDGPVGNRFLRPAHGPEWFYRNRTAHR